MKRHYFHTCKDCGSNLDPGESCDCQKKPNLKIVCVSNPPVYVCDRRACNTCNPDCRHTTDIRHAENFALFMDMMVEKE